MAQTRPMIKFTLEVDAFNDAMDDLGLVARRIVKFHGQKYRDLDRRIEEFEEDEGPLKPKIEWLDRDGERVIGTILIALPPPEVTAILRDARRLGVI